MYGDWWPAPELSLYLEFVFKGCLRAGSTTDLVRF